MKYIRTPKPKREHSHIPFRLNLLFFFVFVLLAALVAQLAYLQIMNGGKFRAAVDSTGTATVTGTVPRGEIFDSKGRALVTNQPDSAITYTKGVGVTSEQMRQVADTLGGYITVTVEGMLDGDYADYYLADPATSKAVIAKLPAAMQKSGVKPAVLYQAEREYAKKHLPTFTAKERQAAFIYKKLNGASQLTTVYVKDQDVTTKEVATVGEHLTKMSGVNLGTNWTRTYPNGSSMAGIIGTVSSEKAGLPEETINAYLANGYARNDRVGTSYLEKAYENVLRGAKSRTQVEIGNNNTIVDQVQQFKGEQGANLNLTIDSQYQAKVQSALTKTFAAALKAGKAQYADGAYAVAINPNTGAILAIAGRAHNTKTGKVTDDSLGVINRAFTMGSVAKPAMVLGALQDGVITTTNNTQSDVPIYLPGTAVKKSDYAAGTFGSLTAAKALAVSSNIYMMRLAMKEGNAKYVPHKLFGMDNDIFTKMRYYFSQFGLGQKTGIDLPGETTGQAANTINPDTGLPLYGSALDFSFGNFDTYTLIQEAQYVSAIANNGYRLKPYVVKSISKTLSNGQAGPTVSTTVPTVLSKVKNTQAQLNLVKQGMWEVVHGTSGWSTGMALKPLNPGVAGKTGTAQSFAHVDPDNMNSKMVETITQSFIGFAPAKNPQVAIAVVVPNLSEQTSYALDIAKQMFTDYYSLYKVAKVKNYSETQATING
ncbi:peptidoglycan D,D-transpeptidase FtsI family protein [Lacticaseibacillus suihuaensis]